MSLNIDKVTRTVAFLALSAYHGNSADFSKNKVDRLYDPSAGEKALKFYNGGRSQSNCFGEVRNSIQGQNKISSLWTFELTIIRRIDQAASFYTEQASRRKVIMLELLDANLKVLVREKTEFKVLNVPFDNVFGVFGWSGIGSSKTYALKVQI